MKLEKKELELLKELVVTQAHANTKEGKIMIIELIEKLEKELKDKK